MKGVPNLICTVELKGMSGRVREESCACTARVLCTVPVDAGVGIFGMFGWSGARHRTHFFGGGGRGTRDEGQAAFCRKSCTRLRCTNISTFSSSLCLLFCLKI